MLIPAYLQLAAVPGHLHFTAQVLQAVFLVGVAGCMISIPIIAAKFASVLFEKSDDENEKDAPREGPEDDEANYGSVGDSAPKPR